MTNPPESKHTQFKKGNKAAVNKGRPRTKEMNKILRGLGANTIKQDKKRIIDCETGEVVKDLTEYEALALRLYYIAQNSEAQDALRAIQMITDRVDGKVTDKVEQTNINPYTVDDEKMVKDHMNREFKKMIKNMTQEDFEKMKNGK